VPVVLLVGLGWGLILSYVSEEPREVRFGEFRGFYYFNPDPLYQAHIVLSTISVALLISLVVVYVKMYSETKANFALGLVVVLGALLLQTLLSYPVLIGLAGPPPFGPGYYGPSADILTIGAYTIFLYLSLE
jgi:hypothetical protein